MAKPLNVVVIGAGTLGLSSALELATRGAAVTVIEADGIASGSSGRSIGVVGTQHVDDFQVLIRTHSLRHLRAWQKRGLVFNAIGYMRLARTEGDIALLQQSLKLQRSHGIASSHMVDRADLQKLVPHMSLDGLVGGLIGPEDGFLDPHQLCTVIAELFREQGGVLKQACRLESVERRGAGYRLATSKGVLDCDAVVNAAGAWAPKVAAMLGQELHVIPQRHEAVTILLEKPLPYVMPMVMDYVPGSSNGTGLNFRHDRPGQLISEIHTVLSPKAEDPDRYNEQMNEAGKEFLAELLLERLPTLPGAAFGRGWAGLYPKSFDGKPLVGPIDPSEPRLVTAAGAGGYGIQLGPVIGQLAADWVLDGRPSSIPEAICLAPTPDRNRPLASAA